MGLINADKLLERITGLVVGWYKNEDGSFGDTYDCTTIVDVIKEAPVVDAEIRVRCEDCVSSGGDRYGELICQNQLCPCYGREVDHAFSCILGERRAEDG